MERQRGLLVLGVIYFLRSCQLSRSLGLAFDNQLVIVANDCYTRVAIGSKLPDADVSSSVAAGSISECEDECSRRRNSCSAFAFGIGIKGNGTCALSAKSPKLEELQSHPDYDVYLRSQRSPHCEPDRLYKMDNGVGQERGNETRPTIVRFGGGLLGPTATSNILTPPRVAGDMVAGVPLYQQGFAPSLDDKRRVSDILRNRNAMPSARNPFGTKNEKIDNYNDVSVYSNRKSTFGQRIYSDHALGFGGPYFRNPLMDVNLAANLDSDLHSYKALTVHNRPFELFSRPILVHDVRNKSPTDLDFWSDRTRYRSTLANHRDNRHRDQGFHGNSYGNSYGKTSHGVVARPKQNELISGGGDVGKGLSRPATVVGSSYAFATNHGKTSNAEGFKDTSGGWSPLSTAFRSFGARITEKTKSCYRRLLSGKKSLELHVRRAVECERIDDCHRACDYEKLFTCEGFNYRRIGHGARGMCEMTSTPYSRMDLHRDFVTDPQCDYYEKDPNCATSAPGATQAAWWNQPFRPSQAYGPPSNGRPDGPRRPYTPDRRPPNELPRPLDYDRRPFKEIPRPLEHDRKPSVNYDEFHRVLYDDTFGQRSGGYPDNRDSTRTAYLPARPEDRFGHGGRFPPRRPPNDDFYEKHWPWAQGFPKYPDRRVDHGPTYDIGTNEIGTYGVPDPGKDYHLVPYGAVYGGSYGYDTNYVGKFDVPKQYPRPKPPRPYENEHFYGEFYNYGGAFGYGDSYIPADQDPLYGGSGKNEECSVRAGAGFRLSRNVVRKTYLTPNLDQCEGLCISERSYICMSFSYRYNVAPTDPTDNCLLSGVSYKDLNFYTDLEPDRDYDIYAMIANSRTCGTQREASQHPPDECFWRVRSGFGMPTDVVRKSTMVDNLGACQVECATSRDFTCRSFAFKYGPEHGRQDGPTTNCHLSDWPTQDINPANMPDMDGAELYERGSFGRGCEPYSVPFFNAGRFNDNKSPRGDEVCYSGYDKPCKLTPYVVLLATYVNSEQDCRQKCSRMRERDSIPCMSYSYKLTTHGTEENCLLSDVPIRDLRPGLDYTYDDNHVLYAWKDLDPHCVVTGYSIDDDHVFGGAAPPRPLLPVTPSRPDFSSDANYPNARPGDIYPDARPFPRPSTHYGVQPVDPDRPDPLRPYRPDGGYGGYGDKFGQGARPGGYDGYGGSLYPDEYTSTFRYYTVNGYPCKRGTKCERNKIAGFWACETEGSEYGSWDYCCAPIHNCGFSQGYHYPWCYVGASEDQWRPCSEKYFPYLPSPRPIRPTIDGEHRHDRPDSHDPNYGRHWPITYWHREPPPNCTDSLASADNTGPHRQNETTPPTVEKPLTTTMASAAANGNETGTAIAKTRRRRLRSRITLVNKDARDGRVISTRKIGTQTTATRVEPTSRERVAKIQRVSKPASTVTFAALDTNEAIGAPAAPIGNASGGAAKFEFAKSDSEMIRVPLIAPNYWNYSLPTAA